MDHRSSSPRPRLCLPLALFLSLAGAACSQSKGAPPGDALAPPNAADAAPSRPERLPTAFCESPRDDVVRSFFCEGESEPAVTSLADLQRGLKIAPGPTDPAYGYGFQPMLLSHSTALSGRLVSPVNPRAIFSGDSGALLTYQRGVQQVELAALDRRSGHQNFYLVTFEQACTHAAGGCTPGDLFTPAVESDWTNVAIRDDEELKNTPSDCRQCHQRARKKPTLLMRELEAPWTHFFAPDVDSGEGDYALGIDGALFTAQYREAKGTEPYAGAIVDNPFSLPSGFLLETLVDKPQALFFDSNRISTDLHGAGGLPVVDPAKRSTSWDAAYSAFQRGEQLALPYFAPVVTDAAKLAAVTSAYRRYLEGTLDASELPDMADVFPDDPRTRAELGLQVDPEATPAEALVQACGTCHNDVLDQRITRARFNVDLSRLSREELDVALERLALSPDDPAAMPPREARQLTAPVKERLVEYLRRGEFSDADREFLDHAATSGMAGGGQPWPSRALPKEDY
jgi:hypothetical protein